METADHFKFLSIQDAMKCINQKVNITGIIVEFSSPKRSRGTGKRRGDEVNAVFNKTFSSFALYNGNDSDDFVPYQVSSKLPGAVDKMLLTELRKWLLNSKLIQDSSNLPMLREINGVHCKLICEILPCRETANQEWMIFVWDGTDLRPNSISSKLLVGDVSYISTNQNGVIR